jgi:hypothetical protein
MLPFRTTCPSAIAGLCHLDKISTIKKNEQVLMSQINHQDHSDEEDLTSEGRRMTSPYIRKVQ